MRVQLDMSYTAYKTLEGLGSHLDETMLITPSGRYAKQMIFHSGADLQFVCVGPWKEISLMEILPDENAVQS